MPSQQRAVQAWMDEWLDVMATAIDRDPEMESLLMLDLFGKQRPRACKECAKYEIHLEFRLPEDD